MCILCYLRVLSEFAALFLSLTSAVPECLLQQKVAAWHHVQGMQNWKWAPCKVFGMAKSGIDPVGLPNCQSGSRALPVNRPVARRALIRNSWRVSAAKMPAWPQIGTFKTWTNSLLLGFSSQMVLITNHTEAFNITVSGQELWIYMRRGSVHRFFS